MKSRGIAALSMVLSTAVLVTGCGGAGGEGNASDDSDNGALRIAGTGPLTGTAAAYGIANRQGAELAVDDVNERGNLAFDLELTFEDDKCDAAAAQTSYRRMMSEEPDMLFGGACSPSALVVAENAQADGIPFLNTSATAPELHNPPREYVFNVQISSADESRTLIDLVIREFEPDTVGFMYTANDYGVLAVDAAKAIFAEVAPDIEIVADAGFPMGTSNFRSGLTRVREDAPDVLLVVGTGAEPGEMVTQAKDVGIDSEFVGFSSLFTIGSMRTAGDALTGVTGFFYTPDRAATDSDNEELAGIVERYEERFGEFPDGLALQAYTGILVLEEAFKDLEAMPETPDEIVEALESVKDFDSNIFKPITFGPDDRTATTEGVLMHLLPGRHEETSLWGNFEILDPAGQ